MTQTFRIFLTPIAMQPNDIDYLISSACILHNLMRSQVNDPENVGSYDSRVPETFSDLSHSTGNNSLEGKSIREKLMQYFLSPEGEVLWQNDR